MAELPELMILARQMNQELNGKEFDSGELLQEKSLNLAPDEFIRKITDKTVLRVYNK